MVIGIFENEKTKELIITKNEKEYWSNFKKTGAYKELRLVVRLDTREDKKYILMGLCLLIEETNISIDELKKIIGLFNGLEEYINLLVQYRFERAQTLKKDIWQKAEREENGEN